MRLARPEIDLMVGREETQDRGLDVKRERERRQREIENHEVTKCWQP